LFRALTNNSSLKAEYPQLFEKLEKSKFKLTPRNIAVFLMNNCEKKNLKTIKDVLESIIKEYTVETLDAEQIQKIVSQVIEQNPQAVADYKAGKQSALQFLLGKTMQILRRKVDVAPIIAELKKQLNV